MARTVFDGNKKGKPEKDVTFEFFAPSAKQVWVAGTFNSWNSVSHPLKKTSDGSWKLTVSLKPGRYEYRYFVDGDWENDQRPVACVPNAFGTWNCVVEVK